LVVAREGEGGVAPLAGAAVGAVEQASVDHDAAPDPGPQSGAEHDVDATARAAAPSVASDRTKQLASLSTRTGRPIAAARSRSTALPFSAARFELTTSPVTGDRKPGVP